MRAVLLLMVLLLVAGLVGLSTWAAQKEEDIESVSAVEVANSQVLVAVDGEVWVADLTGTTQGQLVTADGTPWAGGNITSIALGGQGDILLADATQHVVDRFDANRRFKGTWPLPVNPGYRFHIAAMGDDLWVADTIGHEISRVRPDGTRVGKRAVKYPNGLTVVDSAEGPRVLVLSTGIGRAFVLTPDLGVAHTPQVDLLNSLLGRRQGLFGLGSALDLTASGGVLSVALCRGMAGECAYDRIWPDGGIETFADVEVVHDDGWNEDVMMETASALLPSGALLVSSPRAGALLEFSGSDGGAPPAGFCQSCQEGEMAKLARPVEDLKQGFRWPNGTLVRSFGDEHLQAIYSKSRATSAHYRSVGAIGRWVLYGALVVLTLALVAGRWAGRDWKHYVQQVWAQLVRPLAVELSLYSAAVGGSAGLVGAAVFRVAGGAAALSAGVVAGLIVARWVMSPWMARRIPPALARTAFELNWGVGAHRQLTLREGEEVAYVSFGLPLLRRSEAMADIGPGLLIDDVWELIAGLVPRALLVARTSQRILLARSTLWGAPVGEAAVLEITSAREAGTGILVARQAGNLSAFELGGDVRGELIDTSGPRYYCRDCGGDLASCPHRRLGLRPALLASGVFPGLGQLGQRRFGVGRALAAVGLLALLAGLREFLPQVWGTSPFNPFTIMLPAVGLFGIWLASLGELLIHERIDANRKRAFRGI